MKREQETHDPDPVAGTRDVGGSRQGGLGRSEFDLDLELPTQASTSKSRRQQLPSLGDPFFDDDETVFDIRGQRTSRRALVDDFANEVAATTNRLKSRLNITKEQTTLEDVKQQHPTKWTKLALDEAIDDFNVGNNAAAERARKSKARLSDLEQEMEEMAEKQARREKRAAALRALVNETNAFADESLAGASSSSVVSNHQTIHRSTEKSEKHVSF